MVRNRHAAAGPSPVPSPECRPRVAGRNQPVVGMCFTGACSTAGSWGSRINSRWASTICRQVASGLFPPSHRTRTPGSGSGRRSCVNRRCSDQFGTGEAEDALSALPRSNCNRPSCRGGAGAETPALTDILINQQTPSSPRIRWPRGERRAAVLSSCCTAVADLHENPAYSSMIEASGQVGCWPCWPDPTVRRPNVAVVTSSIFWPISEDEIAVG